MTVREIAEALLDDADRIVATDLYPARCRTVIADLASTLRKQTLDLTESREYGEALVRELADRADRAVKPLVWEESLSGRWIGTPPVKLGDLAFWIFQAHDGYIRFVTGVGRVVYPTPEAAKSAAQNDYTARIHAALRANATDASEGER